MTLLKSKSHQSSPQSLKLPQIFIFIFQDLNSLPRNSALRKLNDLIKRARLAKVHMRIISELKSEMPACFGKESKKKELIKKLSKIYEKIQREQQVSLGDFPKLETMKETLMHCDFSKFKPLDTYYVNKVGRVHLNCPYQLGNKFPKKKQY